MKLYLTQIDPPSAACRRILQAKGWQCGHLPFRRVVFQRLDPVDFGAYDALILTSKQAARWLVRQRPNALPPLAVVGRATAELLADYEQLFKQIGPVDADSLLAQLRKRFPKPARFLFLRGAGARETLLEGLADHELTAKTVYHTRKLSQNFPPLDPKAMVYFQAPSTVSDFLETYQKPPYRIAAIGASTARAIQGLDWSIHFRPSRPELKVFAEELPKPANFLP